MAEAERQGTACQPLGRLVGRRFLDISHAAQLLFLGPLTAGADIAARGRLQIRRDGTVPKFVDEVRRHLQRRARRRRQCVLYSTERCVLRTAKRPRAIEIAPAGSRDGRAGHMAFAPGLRPTSARWTRAIFTDAPLGLADRSPLTLDERVDYRADDALLFINFEGLTLDTLEAAEELAKFMGGRLHGLGRRVNLVVNYDNFELGRAAAPRFFEMVREHERRYFLSSTRYSTDAFLRRKLGRAFADARLSQTIYRSFEEGTHALGEHAVRPRPAAKPRDGRA